MVVSRLGRSHPGVLTRDLRIEGSEGEQEDGGHALEEELLWKQGARHNGNEAD